MAIESIKDDIIRERELFRYFQPPLGDTGKDEPYLDGSVEEAIVNKAIESPDRTLTALAQLAACRLDSSRAMISVIGREMQHFIAEATRTLRLSDTSKSEDIKDGLWVGCATVNKEGRLCEKTIELAPDPGQYPCFTVTDLTADARFSQLPFVTGPPFFKFYAGTPLTTKKGINIGSLFIIDDRVRPELTAAQVDFLGTVAGIVMRNMELNQEAEERKRSLKMSGALNAFQEGGARIQDPNARDKVISDGNPSTSEKIPRADSIDLPAGSVAVKVEGSYEYRDKDAQSVAATAHGGSDESTSSSSSGSTKDPGSENSPSKKERPLLQDSTFVRAASLLRQSLDLESTGGVVFLDANAGSQGLEPDVSPDVNKEKQSHHSADLSPSIAGSFRQRATKKSSQASNVIGFSSSEFELGTQTNLKAVRSFSPLSQSLLQSLLERYPRGKLWSFDSANMLSAWDEDLLDNNLALEFDETVAMRHRRKQTEATLLSRCFPHVMAEANRIAYIAAERQKGDFIGSISHELRSPLHGILASAEFLVDTEQEPFSSSLIATITSCGRTLLDTVNHILDYSKINAYEKNVLTSRKSRAQKSTKAITHRAAVTGAPEKEAPPLMNIYATTDVAAVTEEVVEGVYAGQMYQDISSTDIAFMSTETKTKISEQDSVLDGKGIEDTSKQKPLKDVEVILNIAQGDYVFTCQPGALRRIIMNLFGNSLKYTDKGVIIVSLSLSDTEDDNSSDRILELTIKDSGKGITSEYLRSSLFTPFSQEDNLSTGVGLGLSIVKAIINLLNGSIDIRSKVGVGTEVSVKIPLLRLAGTSTVESTPSTATSSGSLLTCMQSLQSNYVGKYAALYRSNNQSRFSSLQGERMRVLRTYVTQWFGLKAAARSDPTDIVIVDERDVPEMQATGLRRYPAVVLCGKSPSRIGARSQSSSIIEFVSKPFGPYKLAKAVLACLEKAKGISNAEPDYMMTFPPESPIGSDADTVIPNMGSLKLSNQASSQSSVTEQESKSDRDDFPFPKTGSSSVSSGSQAGDAIGSLGHSPDLIRRDSRRPKLSQRATDPVVRHRTSFSLDSAISSAVTKSGELATSTSAEATAEIAAPVLALQKEKVAPVDSKKLSLPPSTGTNTRPRLLLVDDNSINLRLLQTFMKKRKYKFVDLAVDGKLAVDAAEANQEGYDVIFMDISMPVMNGFEATRAIREIEDKRNEALASGASTQVSKGGGQNHALIIALTGLASSRDQTEAFESGVDLFLTKPVSFQEVGRILNNWEQHSQEGDREASVPST